MSLKLALHSEMTLYMAQEISPIYLGYELYAFGDFWREASPENVSELTVTL
jgi:hypothetical protein